MKHIIAAIDPGTTRSAFCILDTSTLTLVDFGIEDNAVLKTDVENKWCSEWSMAIEMVQSFGMPVGSEIFETCVWIGWFTAGMWQDWHRIYRSEEKHSLCHNAKANDASIHQRLVDMFGGKERAVGYKKSPGPLYGVKKDIWSALAIAVTYGLKAGRLTLSEEGLLRPGRSSPPSGRGTS